MRIASLKKLNTYIHTYIQGKTHAALKILSKDYENAVHKIDILKELKAKHPPAAEVKPDSLLFGQINEVSQCYFHEIDEIMIAKAASLTKGAGGPSHLDSHQFRHLLLRPGNFAETIVSLRRRFRR